MTDPIEYLMFLPLGFIALVLIFMFFKLIGLLDIFPIRIFDSYYKQSYLSCRNSLKEKEEELQNFKAEIYEKETIQEITRDKKELEKKLSVADAQVYELRSCNETLTEALKNKNK